MWACVYTHLWNISLLYKLTIQQIYTLALEIMHCFLAGL